MARAVLSSGQVRPGQRIEKCIDFRFWTDQTRLRTTTYPLLVHADDTACICASPDRAAARHPQEVVIIPGTQDPPSMRRPVSDHRLCQLHPASRPMVRHPRLSRREIEVLVAWLRAESKQEAAMSLFISVSTVSTHVARIRTKYESVGRAATTKSALFARAIQDGYVTLDDW
ncbi:response regulator transcription factor [Gordonia sp. DT30]|uniref:response regulator transcription factor n=1 Tax=unclassified Gordonia (in: high G+C Gram-positive bacteria) TaxID=2657482 RepID=UPI003CE74D09